MQDNPVWDSLRSSGMMSEISFWKSSLKVLGTISRERYDTSRNIQQRLNKRKKSVPILVVRNIKDQFSVSVFNLEYGQDVRYNYAAVFR